MSTSVSRRQALTTLGLATTADLEAAWQHAHQMASSAAPKFEYLAAGAASEIEAITSQIIPSDGTPGAREAGVIYFIDRALATWDSAQRERYTKGMQQLQVLRNRMFPASASLASLKEEEIQPLIASIEKSEFFDLLRRHTAQGFLGAPSYGGNRNGVGWAHIGFEDKMSFQPPFGYYDAEALREGKG